MKTLILMRHTKSDWPGGGMADFDRPLNDRGKRNARTMGNWLRDRKLHPGEALVSSARRTQETWERLGISGCQVWFLEELYNAGPRELARALRQAQSDIVLMIAHNPGIAEFATSLLEEDSAMDPEIFRYPTGATTVIRFAEKDWNRIGPGTGTLVEFAQPRVLEAE